MGRRRRYTCQNERGTMAMVTRGPMKDVYFGFNLNALLIRIDFDTPANVALAISTRFESVHRAARLGGSSGDSQRRQPMAIPLKLVHQGNETSASDIQAGWIRLSSWRFRLPGSALRLTSRSSFTSSCWKAGKAATARPEKAPSISLVLRRILSKLCGTSNEGIERVFCQQPSELADAGIAKGSNCRSMVIIATERAETAGRAQAGAQSGEGGYCPFCEGQEDKTPHEIIAYRDAIHGPTSAAGGSASCPISSRRSKWKAISTSAATDLRQDERHRRS